jgi:hypothetical protein
MNILNNLKVMPLTRTFTIICLLLLESQVGHAQTKAYRIGKPNISGVDESISIIIDTSKGISRGGSVGYVLPGLVGNIISTGIDLIKIALSNEEQKYTATYSGSITGSNLMRMLPNAKETKAILNIDSIHIIRNIVMPDMTSQPVTEIVLVPEFDKATGLFRFKLARLFMEGSKAKIKKTGKKGKLVDLNIEIKLEAIWKELQITSKEDSEKLAAENDTSLKESTFNYKSATLGSSSIVVNKITPKGANIIRDNFYSGWFQLLPSSAFKAVNRDNKGDVGNYTLTISIKEANPYGVSAQKLTGFLNSGSTDISSIIKQLLPSTK